MKGHVLRRCPKPVAEACTDGTCAHRWAYTFAAGVDPTTRKRRQHTGGGFPTRLAAEQACRAAVAQAEAGTLLTPAERVAAEKAAAPLTVEEYMRGWLSRKTALRPNTADGYQSHIDQHIVPALGSKPLQDLTVGHVQAFLADLAKPHPKTGKIRTKATLARIRTTLTSALNAAVLDELIPKNPAFRVPLPDNAAPSRTDQATYSVEELGRLLSTASADRIGTIYYVEAYTGLRRGELVGLRWPDVDLDGERPSLTVRHTITQRSGQLRHDTPKTRKSQRVVALDLWSADQLRRHRVRQNEERHSLGPAWQDQLGLVFTQEDGSPLRPDYVSKHFHELAAAAGIPRIRLQELRHTHASHALAAGVPLDVVSDRLGHTNAKYTQDAYKHVGRAIASAGAEMIASILPKPPSRA